MSNNEEKFLSPKIPLNKAKDEMKDERKSLVASVLSILNLHSYNDIESKLVNLSYKEFLELRKFQEELDINLVYLKEIIVKMSEGTRIDHDNSYIKKDKVKPSYPSKEEEYLQLKMLLVVIEEINRFYTKIVLNKKLIVTFLAFQSNQQNLSLVEARVDKHFDLYLDENEPALNELHKHPLCKFDESSNDITSYCSKHNI